MIFIGEAGVGKTMMANAVAASFKRKKLLRTGRVVVASRSDFVGNVVGGTEPKTNNLIESALGGILFVDEAYNLCTDDSDQFGMIAVSILLEKMETYRDDLIVIFAGYPREILNF